MIIPGLQEYIVQNTPQVSELVAFATNIIFTPEDKSGIIICKAVQRREGQQNERTIAV